VGDEPLTCLPDSPYVLDLDQKKKVSDLDQKKMADSLIVAFGEMLIDFVPDTSGVSLAESTGFLKAPGGAPANVACAITKLGGKAAFVGKVARFLSDSMDLFLSFFLNN
jgi:hypothetical protein